MKRRVNDDIRAKAQERGLRLWQIADRYGISDGNFSRLLRRELSEEKRDLILAIIEDVAERKGAEK